MSGEEEYDSFDDDHDLPIENAFPSTSKEKVRSTIWHKRSWSLLTVVMQVVEGSSSRKRTSAVLKPSQDRIKSDNEDSFDKWDFPSLEQFHRF